MWCFVATAGCVNPFADKPKEDFDEYLDRTNGIRGVAPDSGTPVEIPEAGPPPEAGVDSFSGDYIVVCLAALSFKDIQKTLRFKGTVTYTKTNEQSGSLKLTVQMLKIGAVNLSEPVGPTFEATGAATGLFATLAFGNTPDLPSSANALTGTDFGIDNFTMKTTLTGPPETFCSNISGKTRPSGIVIEGTGADVCLFQRVTDPAADQPIPEAAKYVCPIGP